MRRKPKVYVLHSKNKNKPFKKQAEISAEKIDKSLLYLYYVLVKDEVIKMNKSETILTSAEILEKSFKIDTRGYRPKEVDKFLDMVIKDYVEFEKTINLLSDQKEKLLEELRNLKDKLKSVEDSIEIASTGEKEVPNVDILKRISKLEKMMYDIKTEND